MMQLQPENILQDLIRINTVNPPGNETALAVYLKQIFDEVGIENEIIEPELGRGSFIARLGNGSRKLLYLSHSDVVAAGDDWDFNPFGGEIKDGIIHGRGALDCKDLMAAQIAAALTLAKEGVALNGQLIIAAVADEERGGALGAGHIANHFPDKLQGDFAINEGAEQPIILNGRKIYFFQVGEKGTSWCRLVARGVSCHGSVPTLGDNAVLKMARALDLLRNYKPQVKLIPEVKTLLEELAGCRGLELEVTEGNVDEILDGLKIDTPLTETLRAMTRMTISPNVIHGGLKTNIVPDECEAELDIRILPGQDREYVIAELHRIIGDDLEIEITEYKEPTFSTADSTHYRLISEVTKDLVGEDTLCLPHISTGSTDSKYLRNMGIPAYGIGHMAENFDQSVRVTIHGRNERTDLASLHLKTEFLTELARRYLTN